MPRTPSPRDPVRTSRAARLGGIGATGLLVLALVAPGAPAAAAITEFALPTAGSGPEGIAAGPDGNLWFTQFSGNQIGRITPGGSVTEFALPTASSFPPGITAGPDGHLWFTESNGNNIARLTTPAVLRLSPASGILASTQHFDLVLVLQAQGLAIVGGQALVDGLDVTAALASCLLPGTRLAGGATFRCPGLTGGLLVPGVHVVSVSLTLSDGSTAADTARWQVDANTEP